LNTFKAHRAGVEIGLELRRGLRSKAGADIVPIDVGEQHHPVFVFAGLERLDTRAQPIARSATQVDEDLQVVVLHPLHDAVELRRRNRCRLVAMDVDDRKLGARHRMLRHHQR
jgi:hypothetical protein